MGRNRINGSVTLRDVAVKADVSVSTASRILSGVGFASHDARQKVLKAARDLNYRPNTLARTLKTQRSKLIGVMVHNIVNVSYRLIAETAQNRLARHGYQVILCITRDDPDEERRYLTALLDYRVDGLIITPTGSNAPMLADIRQSGLPIIVTIRRQEGVELETILQADPEGAYQGTKYLLDLGHRRIGLIAGRNESTSGRERRAGYTRALQERGIGIEQELIHIGPFEPETGVRATERFLNLPSPPTALFIANNESSMGVFKTLNERQIRIPDDLSVLGYEDIPWFQWQEPPITVVDNDAQHLAHLTVDALLRRLLSDGADISTPEVRVGARLVVRRSCAAPGGDGGR